MSVYDRWHLTHPPAGTQPCKCGRGRNKLYPSADHEQGKRWQVRYRDDTGRQKKANFADRYGDNPAVHAEAFDADNTAKLNSGGWTDPAAGKVSLSDYARQWRAGQTADPATLRVYDGRLKHIHGTAFGQQPMSLLAKRPSMVQQWVKGLDLAPATVRHAVGVLSMIFNAAIQDGIVARNPVHATSVVKPPKVVRRSIVPWTLEQVEAARAAMDDRYRATVDLGAGCGMRQGEIFAVEQSAVDFLHREVHVRLQVRIIDNQLVFSLPKGGKERTVPLDEQVQMALAAHIAACPPVEVTLPWVGPGKAKSRTALLLFTRPGGQALHQALFNDQQWRPARRAAGVAQGRENGMHGLRHTFASACLAGGVDIRTLADWLGHSDPGFTLRTYTHLMPSAADRGRQALAAFWSGGAASALDVPSRKAK